MKEKLAYEVETQYPDFPENALEEARSLLGVWLRRDVLGAAIYESISHIDIRRWAEGIGDDNPLWCSMDYGRRTKYGSIIAPPSLLYSIDTTIVAPKLRGIQWIYGGTEWEFHRVVRPADTITAMVRLVDAVEKHGRTVKRFIEQIGEILFLNQRDELVARALGKVLRIPRAKAAGGGSIAPQRQKLYKYNPEEIAKIESDYEAEVRRGSEPRYWEDVNLAEEMVPVVKGPLCIEDMLAYYAGGKKTYDAHGLALKYRKRHPADAYVDPRTGAQGHPARGHLDPVMATEVGMPGVYDLGPQRISWVMHLITNWMGDLGFLKYISVTVRRPNVLGDTTWCRGKITDKLEERKRKLVKATVWTENQLGEQTADGIATIELPSRQL